MKVGLLGGSPVPVSLEQGMAILFTYQLPLWAIYQDFPRVRPLLLASAYRKRPEETGKAVILQL